MIEIVDNHPNFRALVEEEIGRLERLLFDLRRLLDDDYPRDDELNAAVILINPQPDLAHVPALKGFAAGHP